MLLCCADEYLNECDLLYDIKNKPHEVFINDLMFCICQEFNISWVPPCYRTYAIHVNSPLKANVCNFVKLSVWNSYALRELAWYYICEEEQMSEVEAFEKYTSTLKERINRLVDFLITDHVYQFFIEILKVCIDCVVFYDRGMRDAICFGVTAMTELLLDYFTEHSFDKLLGTIKLLFRKFPAENTKSDRIVKLPEMFACDILFYFCTLYDIEWSPYNNGEYTLPPRSPLTQNIRDFLKKYRLVIEVTSINDLKKYYNRSDFSRGLPKIEEEISASSIPYAKSAEEVFMLVAKTACLAVKLNKDGKAGIIAATMRHLSEALSNCNKINNGRIFYLFDALAVLQNSGKVNLKFCSS